MSHNDFLNGVYWTEDHCSESVRFNIDDFLEGDRSQSSGHGDDHDMVIVYTCMRTTENTVFTFPILRKD